MLEWYGHWQKFLYINLIYYFQYLNWIFHFIKGPLDNMHYMYGCRNALSITKCDTLQKIYYKVDKKIVFWKISKQLFILQKNYVFKCDNSNSMLKKKIYSTKWSVFYCFLKKLIFFPWTLQDIIYCDHSQKIK